MSVQWQRINWQGGEFGFIEVPQFIALLPGAQLFNLRIIRSAQHIGFAAPGETLLLQQASLEEYYCKLFAVVVWADHTSINSPS